jgi:hypothetical protein
MLPTQFNTKKGKSQARTLAPARPRCDMGDVQHAHRRSRCFGLWFSVSRHRLLRGSTRQWLKRENACTPWKLYEPLGEHVAWGYAEQGGEIQAERKLSGWPSVLPYWGLGQVANFTGLGVQS